jgi:hypothetical protein
MSLAERARADLHLCRVECATANAFAEIPTAHARVAPGVLHMRVLHVRTNAP